MKHLPAAITLLLSMSAWSQVPFESRYTNTGRLGLNITNAGTLGRPDVSTNTQGNPSMEFPAGSGTEHLFEAGIWIGAIVDGQKLVSSSSAEAARGYTTGAAGFEFTALSNIQERSSLPGSSNYSAQAVSHQDFLLHFTDSFTVVPGSSQQIVGHDQPLKAGVKLQTYAWNYSFADYFVILNYSITNLSKKNWDSVYLGLYGDFVVRNVNVTQETGTAFFNKGKGGFDSTLGALYIYQAKGDDIDYTQSYAAIQLLGADWRGHYFHPANASALLAAGYPAPAINCNFWNYNGTNPPFARAVDDVERYSKLSTGMDMATLNLPTGPYNSINNWIQMLSVGPFVQVAAGETVNFAVALVCARQLGGLVNNATFDNAASRKELTEHLGWARRTYLGEDANENGKLDSMEDMNGNQVLERYILPAPPASPKMKVVCGNNKADIYWNNSAETSVDPLSRIADFEGYRLYRTNVGDDLKLNLVDSRSLAGQWDSAGNNVGFNNGFAGVKLDQPVQFDGDSTLYTYHYTFNGLLNGWQYLFTVTAFDKGNTAIELPSLESSVNENAVRVFSGTAPADLANPATEPGVYPNPYKTSAAWDGPGSRARKIMFYNLPARCEVRIYTTAGDVVKTFSHDASTYQGEDIKWFDNFGGQNTLMPGGEHAWDLLTDNKTSISTGIYLFAVKDLSTGQIKVGKFAVVK